MSNDPSRLLFLECVYSLFVLIDSTPEKLTRRGSTFIFWNFINFKIFVLSWDPIQSTLPYWTSQLYKRKRLRWIMKRRTHSPQRTNEMKRYRYRNATNSANLSSILQAIPDHKTWWLLKSTSDIPGISTSLISNDSEWNSCCTGKHAHKDCIHG